MSDQITTAFVREFGTTVDFIAQQKGSRLLPAIGMVERVNGEYHFFDQISATSAVRTTTRHADSPLINTPHSRRRVGMVNVEWGDLIDKFDRVRTLIDPTNPYTRNAGWAIGRELDKIVIESFFADVSTGQTGSSTVSFPANHQVAADFDGDSTKENLTVEKLREARRILLSEDVDPEADGPFWIAVTSSQLMALLADPQVTSADFNTVRALVNGEINTYMGFRFIQTELLETDSAGDRRCPVWANNGMAAAVGQEPNSQIAPRPDKRFSTYVYWSSVFGAVRMQEEKVVEIKCKE